MKQIILLITVLFFSHCTNNNKQSAEEPVNAPPTTTSPAVIASENQYPSITQDEITKIYEQCDYIDFVFYELPFSMSYDNKPAIASALNWISPTVPVITKNCKALGRMVFQSKGDIIIEAEIVVSEANECGHLLWIKDGTPLYANRYNAQGKKYLLGIIQQYQNNRPNDQSSGH